MQPRALLLGLWNTLLIFYFTVQQQRSPLLPLPVPAVPAAGWCAACDGPQASWEAYVSHFLQWHARPKRRAAFCHLCLELPAEGVEPHGHQAAHRSVAVCCRLCSARFIHQQARLT